MFLPALIVLLGGGSNSADPMSSISLEEPSLPGLEVDPESGPVAPLQNADERGWTLSITPYLWMFGMEGYVRVDDTSVDFDAGFDDILDKLDFALMGRVEGWKGGFGLYLDPLYGNLEVEAQAGPKEAELETDLVLVEDNDTGGSSGVEIQFSGRVVGYEFRL